MTFSETELQGCYIIDMTPFSDERGWFARTFCAEEFSAIGFQEQFVQFNHSYNAKKGTFRGMHYQLPPFSESKFIRCIAGAVMDIVVDLRNNSPTFLQHIQVELSAANRRSILIPKGFAHGFQTLRDNSELIYHHTAFFNPKADSGIRYNDSLINILLPLPISIASEKDLNHAPLPTDFNGI